MQMHRFFPVLTALTALAATAPAQISPELKAPFAAQCGSETLDIAQVGHAAPLFTDWDGDGLKDLLVGQFGKDEDAGTLRIYKNVGSAQSPKFEDFTYFQAGGTTGKVPVG